VHRGREGGGEVKLTTKQNEDFAVRKGKDKEGPFVELLTGWDAEQFILTPKEAIRLGNALIKAAQPKKQKEVGE
jgi:hypothetical protein